MKLKNDFIVDIATAHTRLSKKWKNKQWRWSDLAEKCSNTVWTNETAAEYAKLPREEQSRIKDVGGFVGGYLSGGVRKNGNILYRSVATLDIDYGTMNVWEDFTMAFGFAALLYSTHKHSEEHPRFRLVFPLSRQVTPAEYEPLCRKIASELGIDLFDDTTYELPRLFYWPSTSKGADFVFELQDGPACNVDQVLASYTDYTDVSAWPMSSRESDVIAHEMKKAGDPTTKPGVIGAFCRAYSIEDVIDKFLSDEYDATSMEGRYTYKKGSVAGGLVCYEGKFAYSHHETDPCSRQLCNAFDLVRIHKFGIKDEGSRVQDITRMPSYLAMLEFASEDPNVRLMLAREKSRQIDDDFGDLEEEEEESDDEWKKGLDYTKTGRLQSTIANIVLILENDSRMKGHITHDDFSGFDAVVGGLPWNKKAKQWTDRDDANLRAWLERNYDITGKEKISDALSAVLTKHTYHPIRNYLNSLKWDGKPRLEKLIIDYLGAEDTPLNRIMTRKHFVAAVTRVFKPGCKYDYCLILSGPEGAGKSTLLNKMGGEWFNDSVVTTEGKEGMDQLRRAWIIEMGELSSIKRSDVEQVKSYLSKQVDIYRAAYDRRTNEHPRQCVFCGTTNEEHFLKGSTGNRRFWVISINPDLRKYNSFDAIDKDRDQLWAEAVEYYKRGEKLYLDREMEIEARKRQEEFNDDVDDPLIGQLKTFLDKPIPSNWQTDFDLSRRRAWYKNPDPLDAKGDTLRDKVSPVEFICECLGRDVADKEYKYLSRKINKMLSTMPGWEKVGTTRHCQNIYGVQRGFKRIINEEEDDL